MPAPPIGKLATVTACIAASTVLGSVHAFSVFIPQWELSTGSSRAAISFVYSLALISLTIAVMFGHHFYRRLSALQIFLLVGAGSCTGLWLSAHSTNIYVIYLAYGLLFGFANGLGYGYTLQLAGQATDNRHAVSMSLVTAFYAVGAALASQLFHSYIETAGIAETLGSAGAIIAAVCLASAVTCCITRISLNLEPAVETKPTLSLTGLKLKLWLLYGSSVTAGLMVIGHALPIFSTKHQSIANAAFAPTMVAIGNIAGGLCIGLAMLKYSSRTLLFTFALISLGGLLMVAQPLLSIAAITLTGLALTGFSYGATIAVFPIVVTDLFGKSSAPKVYGQIFTAWGVAGLMAPTLSGVLYDRTESYGLATSCALLICLVSIKLIPSELEKDSPA